MRRRSIVTAFAGMTAVGTLAWWQRNALATWALTRRTNEGVDLTSIPADTPTCVLTPEQVEGPFFIRAPMRGNIREDRDGIALSLNLRIVRDAGCQPVQGAVAEIWHCDAAGRYSGFPEELSRDPMGTLRFVGSGGRAEPVNDKRYLRGAQISNADSAVSFQTIFPGWYAPRVPHIHLKLFVGDRVYTTTQFYFPDQMANEIYTTHPVYKPHGPSPYNQANDMVLGEHPHASGLLLRPELQTDGMTADAVVRIS